MRLVHLIASVLILPGTVAAAQRVASPQPSQSDIVVIGREDQKQPPSPVAEGTGAPGYRADLTSLYWENAVRAARCAVKGRITKLSLLAEVVDGTYNSSAHDRAQDWLVRQTAACGVGAGAAAHGDSPAMLSGTIENGKPTIGRGNYLKRASMDERGTLARGAFILEALNRFAPDLSLTRAQTDDPAVRQRLLARETSRARLRMPWDRRYFQVALCMVGEQPEQALALLRAEPDRDGYGTSQTRLIASTRRCTGEARRVMLDRYQLRGFLADATYRWALAVMDRDTIIPGLGRLAQADAGVP